MRLVVAVTVLSLAVSPVWVVTARRLHESTTNGISSLGELLRSVYATETDWVAGAAARAQAGAVLLARRIHDGLVRLRVRARLKPSNENVAQDGSAQPASEVLPPAIPLQETRDAS